MTMSTSNLENIPVELRADQSHSILQQRLVPGAVRGLTFSLFSFSMLAVLSPHACAFTIGGFDFARAGNMSLDEGSDATIAITQSSVAANFPTATLSSANTLTPAYLSTVDVLIVSSYRPPGSLVTLSAAEQLALSTYVLGGGGAIILVDNDSYVGGADAGHESFLDPFGLDVAGNGAHPTYPFSVHNPTVTNPTHPIMADTYGFGSVTVPLFFAFGWFDDLGPDAIELAHIGPPADLPGIAVIEPGVLAPGSGPVVFFSDTALFYSNFQSDDNEPLVLNSIAYAAGIPEPGTAILLTLAMLLTAGAVRARRK